MTTRKRLLGIAIVLLLLAASEFHEPHLSRPDYKFIGGLALFACAILAYLVASRFADEMSGSGDSE